MSNLRLNRRTFLRAGAAAAGSLFLSSPFVATPVRAQPVPPRILFVYGGGGWTPRAVFTRPSFSPPEWGHWSDIMRMAVGATTYPETARFDFSFTDSRLVRSDMSRILDVFWNVRSKMMVFEGLAMLSTGWDPYGDGHAYNHLAAMTAAPAAYEYEGVKSQASQPSLDQRILRFLKQTDPLAISFDFKPNIGRTSGTGGFHYFLYSQNSSGTCDRLPTEGNPNSVFSRLFGGIDTGGDDERRLAERAVFQQLQSQYSDVASRMSGFDKMRIEAHRELLYELDTRLSRPRVACEAPTVGSIAGLDRPAAFESDFNAFADMIAAGFGCGLTRVATLGLVDVPPEAYGLPAATNIHHEYEHKSDPISYYAPGGGNVAAEEGMIQRHLFQARLVERLVRRLDSLPEGDGTVLDNTMVVYISELANGNHGSEYCPFIVFGGGAGALRTGRYIKYPHDNPNPWNRNYANEYTGTSHSRLYLALLRAMGMDIPYIHAPTIPGVVPHAGISGTVDMATSLDRLT